MQLLLGPVAVYSDGVALGYCHPLSHTGLFAINELPPPAYCVSGFCPSAAIVSPRCAATLYCMRLFFGGPLRHLSAHLVQASFQFTRQQLLAHPAPSIICPGPAQSSLVAEIIISWLGVGCTPGPHSWDPCLPFNIPMDNVIKMDNVM